MLWILRLFGKAIFYVIFGNVSDFIVNKIKKFPEISIEIISFVLMVGAIAFPIIFLHQGYNVFLM